MARVERLRDARDAVGRASDDTDGETHEQLNSIERALTDFIDIADEEEEENPHADRLAEIEQKLTGLTVEKEDHPDARRNVEDAIEALDAYRRDIDPEEST